MNDKLKNKSTSDQIKLEQVRDTFKYYSLTLEYYQKRLDEKLTETYLALDANMADKHVLESIHLVA